jgi:cysteinyl-tRNA synthetase
VTQEGAAAPVQVRIYDSFHKQKMPLETREPGAVSIYLCGPTTYDSAHIGHAYSAICFDVIRRSLAWLGYKVHFVRNVTDVDDKIINRSKQTGEPALELSARYAVEYNRDMGAFGVLPPDVEPRVSTHIPEIVALIERLIAREMAYAVGGDVYFQVDRFADYGRLSGQSIDELRAGARVDVDERKRSAVDFALWKAAKPGEPSWPSPWGAGRPGWHIECSAMVVRHLGETFDLHGGGKDLVFPHHENEIAQSQGAYGPGTFARHWMHNGFLNLAGEKMSKSLGNVFGCPQVAAAAGPEAVRMFVVSHHYRSPTNFEVARDGERTVFPDLDAADRRLDYFYGTLRRLDGFPGADAVDDGGEVVPEAQALVPAAIEALSDDFNTPVVVAALGEAARAANKLLDEGKGIPKPVRRRSIARLSRDLRSVGSALGVLLSEPSQFLAERRERLATRRGVDVAEVERLLAERTQARAARDFDRADAIRATLQTRGVEVLDGQSSVDWRVAE